VTDRRAILLLIGIVALAYSDILVLRRGFYLGGAMAGASVRITTVACCSSGLARDG